MLTENIIAEPATLAVSEVKNEPAQFHATRKVSHTDCQGYLRPIYDTMDILNGKWKITLIAALSQGKKRFMELQREVEGIGAKMLSKELQELEQNELVTRTVLNTKPVTVEYEITEYGKTLQPIIFEMASWGKKHRARIMGGV